MLLNIFIIFSAMDQPTTSAGFVGLNLEHLTARYSDSSDEELSDQETILERDLELSDSDEAQFSDAAEDSECKFEQLLQ